MPRPLDLLRLALLDGEMFLNPMGWNHVACSFDIVPDFLYVMPQVNL